jgi:hypothetical protein
VSDDWQTRLSEAERELLRRADVQALSSDEQLAYLRTNRRVGFWITLLAGGVVIFMVNGAALSALVFAFQREDHLLELIGSPLACFGVWAAWQWVKHLRSLGARL